MNGSRSAAAANKPENDGFARREANGTGGEIVFPAGRRLRRKAIPDVEAVDRETLSGLFPKERAASKALERRDRNDVIAA